MSIIEGNFQEAITARAATAEKIKEFRCRLGLTQEAFSRKYDIPLGTLKDWEKATKPTRASKLFTELIEIKVIEHFADKRRPSGPSGPSVT